MKQIYPILLSIFIVGCQQNNAENTTAKEDAKSETNTYYGTEINSSNISNYSDAKTIALSNGTTQTKLEGTIVQTCPKKGCWMSLATETDTLFVKFRDYEFFVPTDGVSGKTAIIEGDLFLDTITVEMRKHYAEDAGKSEEEIAAITEPEYDINFMADGVIIKD